ncbi:MAG: P-II family nitrogen regulator [Chloroflexota bacterium]|nr:P-II family nitrogen regulator [Chloroflexota bacterium]
MKEIIAIVRMNKVQRTRDALAAKGYYSMTVKHVLGRGLQKGLSYELEGTPGPEYSAKPRLNYIPKRMILIVVTDDQEQEVVDIIIQVNQSGNIGDGKIFVSPVSEVIRIRTKETGERAIL